MAEIKRVSGPQRFNIAVRRPLVPFSATTSPPFHGGWVAILRRCIHFHTCFCHLPHLPTATSSNCHFCHLPLTQIKRFSGAAAIQHRPGADFSCPSRHTFLHTLLLPLTQIKRVSDAAAIQHRCGIALSCHCCQAYISEFFHQLSSLAKALEKKAPL